MCLCVYKVTGAQTDWRSPGGRPRKSWLETWPYLRFLYPFAKLFLKNLKITHPFSIQVLPVVVGGGTVFLNDGQHLQRLSQATCGHVWDHLLSAAGK